MFESEDEIEEPIDDCQSDQQHINVFLFQPSMTIINAVRVRPALYNTNLPIDERSKSKRKQLWNEVAEIVNAPVSDVRRRWRALRGRYSRYRRQYFAFLQDVNNVTAIKLPQFQYYRHLKFLEPLMEQQKACQSSEMFNYIVPKPSISPEATDTNNISLVNGDLSRECQDSQEITRPLNISDHVYLSVQQDPLDPLNNNFLTNSEDELTVKNYTNLGKMIALRLRQLKSKRIARNCEIEIMNMMMYAELQDFEIIKT